MTGIQNAGGMLNAIVTKTGNYTLTAADHVVRVDATTGSRTMTLPLASSNIGREYILTRVDTIPTNSVTIAFSGADNIIGGPPSLYCGDVMRVIAVVSGLWMVVFIGGGIITEETININIFDSDTYIDTGDGVVGIAIPLRMNNMKLVDVLVATHTPGGTSGSTNVQVRRRRSGTNNNMLTTAVTMNYNEYYARDGVINASYSTVQTGDIVFIDISSKPSGGTPLGLFAVLSFGRMG